MPELVHHSKIRTNPNNPTDRGTSEEAFVLKESIRQFGIFDPLLVAEEADLFQIISGHRRFKFGKEVGLTEFPIIRSDPSRKACDNEFIRVNANETQSKFSDAQLFLFFEVTLAKNPTFTQKQLSVGAGVEETRLSKILKAGRDPIARDAFLREQINTKQALAIAGAKEADKPLMLLDAVAGVPGSTLSKRKSGRAAKQTPLSVRLYSPIGQVTVSGGESVESVLKILVNTVEAVKLAHREGISGLKTLSDVLKDKSKPKKEATL